jgi:hypothetical protein
LSDHFREIFVNFVSQNFAKVIRKFCEMRKKKFHETFCEISFREILLAMLTEEHQNKDQKAVDHQDGQLPVPEEAG